MCSKPKWPRVFIGVVLFILMSQLNGCGREEKLLPASPIPLPISTLLPLTPTILPSEDTPFPVSSQPTPVTIMVNGESITLVPGNVSPENYELAQTPEFNDQTEWVFVNGMWQPQPNRVTVPLEICEVDPVHLGCLGLHDPTPTLMAAISPTLQTFTDTLGRFAFDYPVGWYTLPVTPRLEDGIQLLDAPLLNQASRWVTFDVFTNPDKIPLSLWVSMRGAVWSGKIVAEQEDVINEVSVIRQTLQNENPTISEPYVYALIWWAQGENILLWTAWPGEQAETLNLLERMVTGFRTLQ